MLDGRGTPFAVAAPVVRAREYLNDAPVMATAEPQEIVGPVNASVGHLSVHVEGVHPVEIPFSFEREPKRMGVSFIASFAVDVLLITAFIFASRYHGRVNANGALLPEEPNSQIVWLSEPGPGGGGGGGG